MKVRTAVISSSGQRFTEGGHVAGTADIIRKAGAAQLNRFNKNSVAMVPGVATGIVGWGSERVVFVLLLPIRFSLKVYPMTLGAIFMHTHLAPRLSLLGQNLAEGGFLVRASRPVLKGKVSGE